MNLIEQLGGYENSKCYLESCGDMDSIGGFTPLQIQEALLEYRRQHNIFEEGDLVVMVDGEYKKHYTSVYPVLSVCGEYLITILFGETDAHYSYFLHATDEEIKVGHRL